MTRGKLIVFEGLDGSGKTTQINLLREKLEKEGKAVYIFRELSETWEGRALEPIILNKNRPLNPLVDIHLWTSVKIAAQAELLDRLSRHDYVLMDRYILSFIVMQGCMTGFYSNCKAIAKDLHIKPDITFFLDTDVSVSKNNLEATGKVLDYFENRGDSYHSRLRSFFLLELDTKNKDVYGSNNTVVHVKCTEETDGNKQMKKREEISNIIYQQL